MTHIESIVAMLKRDVEMVKMTLGDLSDTEMLVRSVPGANHGPGAAREVAPSGGADAGDGAGGKRAARARR